MYCCYGDHNGTQNIDTYFEFCVTVFKFKMIINQKYTEEAIDKHFYEPSGKFVEFMYLS